MNLKTVDPPPSKKKIAIVIFTAPFSEALSVGGIEVSRLAFRLALVVLHIGGGRKSTGFEECSRWQANFVIRNLYFVICNLSFCYL